jgi:hypothetical protein
LEPLNSAAQVVINEELPPDCFADGFYKRINNNRFLKKHFGNNTALMRAWAKVRLYAYKFAENKNFELFIIFMIVLSSLALVSGLTVVLDVHAFYSVDFFFSSYKALEDKFINTKPRLKAVLHIGDKVFTYLFAFEMLLKWVAYGWKKYFSDGWCWLDFIIVTVSGIGISVTFFLILALIGQI